VKQQRLMSTWSELTGRALPADVDSMRPEAADRWLAEAWEFWRSLGHPIV
jgi:hypothetical protein